MNFERVPVGLDQRAERPLVPGLRTSEEEALLGKANFGPAPTVSFGNVQLDVGGLVSSFLAPILEDLEPVLESIGPVFDVINYPIPGLADLAAEFPDFADKLYLNELTANTPLDGGVPLELFGSQYPGGKIFNRAAFAASAPGVQGTFGRNVLRGFGESQADVAAQRQLHATANVRLRFRAELFNVFNEPNFGSPTIWSGLYMFHAVLISCVRVTFCLVSRSCW